MSKKKKEGKVKPLPVPSQASARLDDWWEGLTQGHPKAIHEVRKLTRRAGAELQVSDAGKKVRGAWGDLRRAAATLRDHDVAGAHLADMLGELGAPASTVTRFRQSRDEGRRELLAQTRFPARPPAFELRPDWVEKAQKWVRRSSKKLLAEGQDALQAEDSAAWHEWRKDLKKYRYMLDLLGEVPAAVTDTLDALGSLQDAEVLLELLRSDPKLLRSYRSRLMALAESKRSSARDEAKKHFAALSEFLSNPTLKTAN